jgi:hypothetical protein
LQKNILTPDIYYINSFKRKYESKGILTFFFGAPISDCDKSMVNYEAAYREIADDTLYTLPHRLFIPDSQRVHLRGEAAVFNSQLVAQWLLETAWERKLIEYGKLGPHAEP